jgi:hypothetical protein
VLVAAVFGGHVAVLAAMTLPTYVIARSARPNSPELRLGDVTYERRDAEVDLALNVLLRNRGSKPQGWETNKLKVALHDGAGQASADRCSGTSYDFEVIRVLDGTGAPVKFVLVPPGATLWLAVAATATLDARGEALFVGSREWGVHASMSSIEQIAADACSIRTLTNAPR